MRRLFFNLRKDERGAPLVEFALTLPILVVLLMGTFGVGTFLYANNAVRNAIDQAARTAALHPTPGDAAITTAFNDALLRDFSSDGGVNFSIARGNSGTIEFADLQATANLDVEFVFFTVSDIEIDVERRVFLAR